MLMHVERCCANACGAAKASKTKGPWQGAHQVQGTGHGALAPKLRARSISTAGLAAYNRVWHRGDSAHGAEHIRAAAGALCVLQCTQRLLSFLLMQCPFPPAFFP